MAISSWLCICSGGFSPINSMKPLTLWAPRSLPQWEGLLRDKARGGGGEHCLHAVFRSSALGSIVEQRIHPVFTLHHVLCSGNY